MGLGFGFPAVVAIHWRKKKYSVMRKAFNVDNMNAFIMKLGKDRS